MPLIPAKPLDFPAPKRRERRAPGVFLNQPPDCTPLLRRTLQRTSQARGPSHGTTGVFMSV